VWEKEMQMHAQTFSHIYGHLGSTWASRF
jgi:hypothetical protein